MGPIISVFPVFLFNTGRTRRAAPVNKKSPGYGPPLIPTFEQNEIERLTMLQNPKIHFHRYTYLEESRQFPAFVERWDHPVPSSVEAAK